MNFPSWPSLYLPPISPEITIPPLTLKTTTGDQTFLAQSEYSLYVCGITPYDATHLGHAATYLSFDLIHRYFSAMNSNVMFCENITDIDEPLLERADRDGINWQKLAADQIDLFRGDMTALHVLPPDDFVPATAAIAIIDRAISQMEKNGYVYSLAGDLYFDISSFLKDLPLPIDDALQIFAESGGDPDRIGKLHPLDPVLWWINKNEEPGWESSHGFGRPGWHIECSVISLRYLLGEDFLNRKSRDFAIDIQGGGSDLFFPHHFMSAAQSQALLGIPFARATIHSGMVGLDGEKMSKSKGNLIFVSRLLSDGIDPMVIRLALLMDHYQSDRMWERTRLIEAAEILEDLRTAISREEVAPVTPLINSIVLSLSNNLDTVGAIREIQKWIGECDVSPTDTNGGELSRSLDLLLGIAL